MGALHLQNTYNSAYHLGATSRFARATAVRCWAMVAPAPKISCRVAVIGAGAAGLVSIRELLKEGHHVVAFEQNPKPGGVWVYDSATDSDLLGAQDNRRKVHGSMYRDLRTNLPRELMGFSDVPFTPQLLSKASTDSRRFCSHTEVLAYLNLFADMYKLHQYVQYNTQVVSATPLVHDAHQHANGTVDGNGGSSSNCGINDGSSSTLANGNNSSSGDRPKWQLQTVQLGADGEPQSEPLKQVFDAVVVCNGHYSEPNLPDVPGADTWPGLQMHSHNYRVPEQFAGQVVVIVGASNSGEDVCREISAVADQVIVAARSWKNPDWARDPKPFGPRNNVSRRGMVSQLHADGRVEFTEGPPLPAAHTIIYCTGYRYKFPFLEQHPATAGFSGQQYVPGLYRHMFAPQFGQSLAFVGLPWKVVPFPQFELQAKLIARLLSDRAQLPSAAEMQSDIDAYYKQLQASGTPLRYAHMMNELQWEYNDWLASAAGPDVEPLPSWRPAMYASTGANKRAYPDDYRDRWSDADSAAEADKELTALAQRLQATVA